MLHPIGREGLLKNPKYQRQTAVRHQLQRPRGHKNPRPRNALRSQPGKLGRSILLVTAGQSGQPGSSHYSDQFSYWYEGNPSTRHSPTPPKPKNASTP